MNNERWLSDGKCSGCRRKDHCTTKCKPNKQAIRDLIRKQMMDKFLKTN